MALEDVEHLIAQLTPESSDDEIIQAFRAWARLPSDVRSRHYRLEEAFWNRLKWHRMTIRKYMRLALDEIEEAKPPPRTRADFVRTIDTQREDG